MKMKIVFPFLAVLLVALSSTGFLMAQHTPSKVKASGIVYPSVSGTHLVDSSGNLLVLRGAQIETLLVNASVWSYNTSLGSKFAALQRSASTSVFNEMHTNWHMNALRFPISNWIYTSDPTDYMTLLDFVVQQANQAGLYVVLDLHDNLKSGSPYGTHANVLKPESISFWKTIASHYLANTMVMYDLFNEAQYPDANTWLNGGGTITGSTGKSTSIIGMQACVDAIRSVGAKQILIIGGVHVMATTTLRINDPNIMYTVHVFHRVATGLGWSSDWGNLIGHYPLFYGEWGLLVNTGARNRCTGVTPANADQKVINFMNYLQQNGMNWIAWEFDSPYLILNHSNFAPTSFDDPNHPWFCGSAHALAGMGTVVKTYMASLPNTK